MGDAVEPEEGGALIGFLGDVLAWFADPENWSGADGIPNRLWEHVSLSALAVIAAAALALPLAVYLGHIRRGGALATSAVNLGRAVPSFGLVGVMFPITLAIGFMSSPIGFWATLIAMVLLAMPPMFVNAHTAVRQIDPALVEAGRGMGMSEGEVVMGVEVPVGLPLIMAGVRTAAVAVVATATLGAVVGYGGLGRYIIDGFAQGNDAEAFAGGVMVALLAVVTELGLGWVERRTEPVPSKGRRRPPAPAAPDLDAPLPGLPR
jgi:osmoprotectant transport system permease protein